MTEVFPIQTCEDFSNLIQIPIPKYSKKHYIENTILGIYYIDMESGIRYYGNNTHPDWMPEDIAVINNKPLLSLEKKLLVKEQLLTGMDVNFFYNTNIKFSEFIPIKFKNYMSGYDNLELIPLSKIFEICEFIFNSISSKIELNSVKLESVSKIDELFYTSLYKTESNKIFKQDEMRQFFYSDYNPYTITNRPTNSSNGINFTALSKKDDTRKNIISGDDNILVQFDYSAFHPYLISKILNIEIPSNVDYYTYLNDQFQFSTSDERDKIKEDFFKLIYGYGKAKNKFSEKIEEFENVLLKEHVVNKSIKSFFLKRPLFFKSDINKNVLFNYFLQNMETEHNMIKLRQLFQEIPETEKMLILYIYDSFVFRIPENNTNVISKIEQILIKEGFPVKVYIGKNLQDLQIIN